MNNLLKLLIVMQFNCLYPMEIDNNNKEDAITLDMAVTCVENILPMLEINYNYYLSYNDNAGKTRFNDCITDIIEKLSVQASYRKDLTMSREKAIHTIKENGLPVIKKIFDNITTEGVATIAVDEITAFIESQISKKEDEKK